MYCRYFTVYNNYAAAVTYFMSISLRPVKIPEKSSHEQRPEGDYCDF